MRTCLGSLNLFNSHRFAVKVFAVQLQCLSAAWNLFNLFVHVNVVNRENVMWFDWGLANWRISILFICYYLGFLRCGERINHTSSLFLRRISKELWHMISCSSWWNLRILNLTNLVNFNPQKLQPTPGLATLRLRAVASKPLLILLRDRWFVVHKEEKHAWIEGIERNPFIGFVFELEKVRIFKCQFEN